MEPSTGRLAAVLSVCLLLVVSGARAEETRPFALTSNRLHEDRIDPAQHPRLADVGLRELVRQGLLISARDEFGLATRDETLGETVDRESAETFDVVVIPKAYHGINFTVSRGGDELLKLYIRDMFDNPLAYQKIAEAVEKQSRTEYADMLEKAGYKRRPHEWHDSAELSEEAEKLLAEMNDISQYRALRAIHREISESGESPQRLAGLVRGYANLGQLTIRGIDCRGFVFRCRAWLYAVRLRQKAPDSPLAGWCLAYAQVLAGQPTAGKSTLGAIDAPRDEWPGWAQLLDDYCHYRYEEMSRLASRRDDPASELATLLWVRAVQQLNSKIALLEASQQAMERLPHCLWLQDQMYQAAGVAYLHSLTRMGPPLLSDELLAQLPSVDGLPAAVESQLTDSEELDQLAIAQLATAIVEAGASDTREPSLEVLGRNIEAFNLLHMFRVAWFGKGPLSSDSSHYVEHVLPAIEDHPLAPLLETFRYTSSELPDELRTLAAKITFKEGNPFFGYDLYSTLPAQLKLANTTAGEARDTCWFARMRDEEFIAADVFRSRQLQDAMLHELKGVAKESPLRIGYEVELHFNNVKGKLDEWQEKYGHYPSFHRALGKVYIKRGEYEKAVEHLGRAAQQVADSDVLQSLAEAYYKQEDDRWLESLETILSREDYGLEHARANAQIASTLMSEGKYDEALPYAERGAHSGASWALRVYVECLTAQGSWDEAEGVARADTFRYRNPLWFFWCAATGQGDLDAAWQMEQQRAERFNQEVKIHGGIMNVWYLLAGGDEVEALAHTTTMAEEGYLPFIGMLQALLADSQGNTELRDQALEKLATFEPATEKEWTCYPAMAKAVQQALKENRTLTDSDIDEVFKGRSDKSRWLVGAYYVAGEHNRIHGEGPERSEFLERLAKEPHLDTWARVVAWIRLRQMDIAPEQLEGRRFMMQLEKAERVAAAK